LIDQQGDLPQGLKPTVYGHFAARLNSLVKESRFLISREKSIPQGLKPASILLTILPGMNLRPTARMCFSPSSEAVPFQKRHLSLDW